MTIISAPQLEKGIYKKKFKIEFFSWKILKIY